MNVFYILVSFIFCFSLQAENLFDQADNLLHQTLLVEPFLSHELESIKTIYLSLQKTSSLEELVKVVDRLKDFMHGDQAVDSPVSDSLQTSLFVVCYQHYCIHSEQLLLRKAHKNHELLLYWGKEQRMQSAPWYKKSMFGLIDKPWYKDFVHNNIEQVKILNTKIHSLIGSLKYNYDKAQQATTQATFQSNIDNVFQQQTEIITGCKAVQKHFDGLTCLEHGLVELEQWSAAIQDQQKQMQLPSWIERSGLQAVSISSIFTAVSASLYSNRARVQQAFQPARIAEPIGQFNIPVIPGLMMQNPASEAEQIPLQIPVINPFNIQPIPNIIMQNPANAEEQIPFKVAPIDQIPVLNIPNLAALEDSMERELLEAQGLYRDAVMNLHKNEFGNEENGYNFPDYGSIEFNEYNEKRMTIDDTVLRNPGVFNVGSIPSAAFRYGLKRYISTKEQILVVVHDAQIAIDQVNQQMANSIVTINNGTRDGVQSINQGLDQVNNAIDEINMSIGQASGVLNENIQAARNSINQILNQTNQAIEGINDGLTATNQDVTARINGAINYGNQSVARFVYRAYGAIACTLIAAICYKTYTAYIQSEYEPLIVAIRALEVSLNRQLNKEESFEVQGYIFVLINSIRISMPMLSDRDQQLLEQDLQELACYDYTALQKYNIVRRMYSTYTWLAQ